MSSSLLMQLSDFNDLTDVCTTSMRRRKTDDFRQIRDGRTGPVDVGVLSSKEQVARPTSTKNNKSGKE